MCRILNVVQWDRFCTSIKFANGIQQRDTFKIEEMMVFICSLERPMPTATAWRDSSSQRLQ